MSPVSSQIEAITTTIRSYVYTAKRLGEVALVQYLICSYISIANENLCTSSYKRQPAEPRYTIPFLKAAASLKPPFAPLLHTLVSNGT
jgi:hypothetical protein